MLNTTDNKLKKDFVLKINSVHVEPICHSLEPLCDRSNYSSMVLHATKENFRCAEAFLL